APADGWIVVDEAGTDLAMIFGLTFRAFGVDRMDWGGAPAIAVPGVPSDLEGERSRRTGDATPRHPARRRFSLRLGLLQWAVGGFCGIVGALTFVTPHQFVGPAYQL